MAKAKGKSEVMEVSFRPAKGGVISETRSRTKRGGQGGGPDYDYETENGVHPTVKHAAAHLEKTLGHAFAGKVEHDENEPPEE